MIETNIHPPVIVRWCCFAIALVAFLACLGSSITLVNNLRTGEAIYSSDFRGIIKENITKESHPEKFEEAQKKLVFQIFYQGALFLVCFTFFKKLGD
jgi:E3 ubiquitin-protein ligase DOA10